MAELIVPGSAIPVGAAAAVLTSWLGRHGERQTENLVEELRPRVERLAEERKLDQDRLGRLEELGGMQAVYANLFAVPEKTALYADLLAGVVSTETSDPVDLEAFIDTLQTLSVEEVSLAASMYDEWVKNEGTEQLEGVFLRSPELDDTAYHAKRLEGAGLIVPRVRSGQLGSGTPTGRYDLTPTLVRLVRLLREGRGAAE